MATPQAVAGLRLYKIADRRAWTQARKRGQFDGSPDDVRDGYIHLSAQGQVAGTLARHFAGARDLLLVEVDGDALGAALRWEPARGGALFPHLYAPLPMSAVRSERPLELGANGKHVLPEELV